MFKIKSKILKKLSAGFMAGLCAFSMLGSTMSGVITANAASTSTENSAFPSADTVIAKAATLLGSPYTYGNKGYWYAYNQDQYTPLSVQTINNLGIDCSGLVYYTLTQLGYKTSGFSWNNPVPVDTDHWLTVNDNCTISYGGKTSKVDVEKKNIKTTDRPYWECSNGSTITPGSVVVAQNPYGEDHAWIYMGEFNSRSDVVSYLKSIGVSESLINSKTVGDGKGAGGRHWRIESNGSEGVVINNKTDGKTATAMNMSAFRITKTDVTFEIDKYNTNGDLVGKSSVDNSTAVYGIYSDKSCKNKVAEIKIGSNGKGSVKLPNKTYYAKEIKAPTGYALDKTVYKIKAGVNKVKEDFQTGKIKINKSAEDGIISGRKFKITYSYNGKSLSETAKTNAKGIATFDDLKVYDMSTGKAITYTVSEINVDTRYEALKAKNVKLTDGDVDLTINVKFNNELKTGSIKINKQSEDNHNGGREFTVTGNGKTYSIKTGSDGVAILSDIPVYDSNNQKIVYTISEKNVPVKYVVPASQTVTLTADATTTKTFKNVLKKFTAQVTKQDSETASAQGDGTLSGAVYGIYRNGELVDTYTTDENGYFKTKEYVCGNYTVQEISPSEGYLLDETMYPVGAETENYSIEHNPISMTVTEDVLKGKISIIKHSDDGSTQIETPEVGAEFEVYLKSSGSYEAANDSEKDYLVCDENGEVHESGQTAYTPVFAKENLSGAVFQVIASEDIITADGTIRANAGDVVAELVTDENGYAETDLLYLGKYEVKEITAPDGYVLNAESQFVELTYAGQEIAVRDTVGTAFENDYQGIEISLSKVMENDEKFGISAEESYKNVRFGLFAAEDITAADGSVIPADGLIAEVSLNEDMTAVIAEKIPFGKYYVQEIATDEHYVLNGKKYLVNFEYMGQEVTTVSIDCGQFVNELKRGKIEGIKVNESNEPLENALFGLFAVDTAEFTADNAYMTAVSDENGHFEFDKIPYGEYIVREIEAPTGYILSDESYPVTISEDGEVIEIKAVNKSTKVRISKQDITTGEELPGATIQIIDKDGNVVDEWVSTTEPHFIEAELTAGEKYTLHEAAAPDGYVIANDVEFTINSDGTVTEVVMYDEHTPDLEIPPTVTIDTPNTGVSADNSAEFYLVAAAVVVAFGMVICKRNDKEKRKDDVK